MKGINKKFLLLAAILIAFYLVLIFVIFTNSQSDVSPKNNIKTQPSPTLVQIQQNQNRLPNQNNSVEYSPEEISASKKERDLGELLQKLPYKTPSFELNYEYPTDSFNFLITPGNEQQANQELDALLKIYGLTKGDLQNLFTSSR